MKQATEPLVLLECLVAGTSHRRPQIDEVEPSLKIGQALLLTREATATTMTGLCKSILTRLPTRPMFGSVTCPKAKTKRWPACSTLASTSGPASTTNLGSRIGCTSISRC